jgi:hypothetical protein
VLFRGDSGRTSAVAAGEGEARAEDPEQPEEVADLAAALDERRREDEDDQGDGIALQPRIDRPEVSARGPAERRKKALAIQLAMNRAELTFASAVPS